MFSYKTKFSSLGQIIIPIEKAYLIVLSHRIGLQYSVKTKLDWKLDCKALLNLFN